MSKATEEPDVVLEVVRELVVDTYPEERRAETLARLDGYEADDDGVYRDADGYAVTYDAAGNPVYRDPDGKAWTGDEDEDETKEEEEE